MAADPAVWNGFLDGEIPNVGRAFVWHSETLARTGRYFNAARKGFSATLKELSAIQSRRKSKEKPEPVPVAKPDQPQNKPVTSGLVSFRQPCERSAKNRESAVALASESEETPPLAA